MAELQQLTVYLAVNGAAEAIAFYEKAFGAEEVFRLAGADGSSISHAEMQLGASRLMLSDEHPDFGALAPETVGGSPVKLHLAVEDADATFAQALAAGATELRPLRDQFHGERSGLVADPYGYAWFIAQTVEEVSPAEIARRWQAVSSGAG
ncbi:MAG: VOC family protein [Pseudomonadota bacterium]